MTITSYSPQDVAILRYAYKRARELARRMSFFEGEVSLGHPTFAAGSSATYKDSSPVEIEAPDIVYSAEDDKVIDTFIRTICKSHLSTFQCL
jgi:alcohol oxidase